MNENNTGNRIDDAAEEFEFSGSIHVQRGTKTLLSRAYGYAERADKVPNRPATRFSIASGSKIFTVAAVCRLAEAGHLNLRMKISECPGMEFSFLSGDITIHELLTHTSGMPDYFDEEEMDDYEALWKDFPMYNVRKPEDYLQLIRPGRSPAGAFKYNNAGYIILGLIIEKLSGMDFAGYIEENIFKTAGMVDSGYFPADRLPENVAAGYMEDPEGKWRSNIFSVPAQGGPDGGAYVTAGDMISFWQALKSNRILSEGMTAEFLKPRVNVSEDIHYGYSGYMQADKTDIVKYIQMGYDPGVNFRAVHHPEEDTTIVVCSNHSDGAYEMVKEAESVFLL